MIPALQAEESLRHVTEIAAGNGLIKDPDRGRILQGWRRDVQMGSMVEQKKTTLDSLIGHGIGLRIVKKGESIA